MCTTLEVNHFKVLKSVTICLFMTNLITDLREVRIFYTF